MRAWLEDIIDDTRSRFTGPAGRWRAARWARGLPGGLALMLLCAAVYLPGMFVIPPVDRDEARFAQASRQMFESFALPVEYRDPALHDGGLVIPKIQDRPRLNKPPLIYWAQSLSASLFTGGDPDADAIWMYRLPSALFAALAVLFTWRLGVRLFDPRAAWLGAALLAVCPMVVWEAHQARADQLLLACTTLAMWTLAEIYFARARGWFWSALFWVAIGLGVLAKGPITPMIAALTILCLALSTRRFAWVLRFRPLLGLVIVPALVLPWVAAVAFRVGFGEYWSIITGETLGRSGSAREGHWGPPGYHLALLVVLFWPGVLLTALSLIRAFRRARGVPISPETTEPVETPDEGKVAPPLLHRFTASVRRRWAAIRAPASGRRGELFCLCWIVPAWIVFELIATKLPHYVLPLYPPIALLTARGLLAAADGAIPAVTSDLARAGHKVWLAVGGVIVVAAPVTIGLFGDIPVIFAGLFVGGISAWLLWCAWKRLATGHIVGAQGWSIAGAVVSLAGTLGVVLPNAGGLWVSTRIAALLDQEDPSLPVASAGYHEDSLIFLTRGLLQRIDDPEDWMRAHRSGILITPPEKLPESPARTLTRIGQVRGVNYSRGRFIDLGVYRVTP